MRVIRSNMTALKEGGLQPAEILTAGAIIASFRIGSSSARPLIVAGRGRRRKFAATAVAPHHGATEQLRWGWVQHDGTPQRALRQIRHGTMNSLTGRDPTPRWLMTPLGPRGCPTGRRSGCTSILMLAWGQDAVVSPQAPGWGSMRVRPAQNCATRPLAFNSNARSDQTRQRVPS